MSHGDKSDDTGRCGAHRGADKRRLYSYALKIHVYTFLECFYVFVLTSSFNVFNASFY